MRIKIFSAMLSIVLGLTSLCQAQNSDDLFEIPLDVECPAVIDWWPGVVFPRADFLEARVGNKIIITYEILPEANDPKFSLTTNYGKSTLPGFEGTQQDANNEGRYMLPVAENGSYAYTITEETLAKLKDSEFHGWDGSIRIVGQGLSITGIAYGINESYDEFIPETGEITWNWPGMTIPRSVFTSAHEGATFEMTYELLPDVTEAQFKFTTSYGNRNMPGFPSAEYDAEEGTHVYRMMENGVFSYPITENVRTKLNDSGFHGWDGNVHVTGSGFKVVSLKVKEYRDPAAVEGIFVDQSGESSLVEYYNMQGIRIQNPSGGLFIRKEGKKTTKVIIR